MKRYLLFILSAIVLVSCARELELEEMLPEEVQTEEGLVERTWTVAMNDGTRAILDENMCPVWEVGEELSIYDHVAKVGRIFTVQSVDGYTATISGQISAGGDTPFDAVYPAKSAGEWTSDATNTLKLPETQLIPEGRFVCPDVLVSTAHSDSPDGVISFHNISSLLKVKVDREGIADISLDLKGSSDGEVNSYKAAAAAGTLAEGVYFVAVDPGTYAGGISAVCTDGFGQWYRRSSSSTLEAVTGGMLNLGKVSDWKAWRYYSISDESLSYSGQDALLNASGILSSLSSLVVNLMVKPMLNDAFGSNRNNVRVNAIKYTYLSADPQGKPVELSALLYIPAAALPQGSQSGKRLNGLAIANHGTMTAKSECPTKKAQFEGAFAWKNYAVVMPDYYGFGVSEALPQAYLNANTTARGNIDAYLAAVQLMEDKKINLPEPDGTTGQINLVSFGYSQGGFNSMANLRYVTEHPELGVTFKKTMCGGSPFDVPVTWEAYRLDTENSFNGAIGFIPLTVVSINETQNLGLDYANIFTGGLVDNWQDWILSKEYTLNQINTKIGASSMAAIMTDGMMAGTSPEFEAIMAVCESNKLTSGWTPPGDKTKIIIYHSTNDDIVPYANFTAMRTFLDNTSTSYKEYHGKDGGHVAACVSFIKDIIDEW